MAAKTSAKNIEFQNALKSALKLRAFGVQYSEIIEEVKGADGENYWKSIQACQKVVARALSDDLDQTVEAARNEIVARNERRILPLMEKFETGKSILVSKEIGRIDDSTARLKGLYAPTKITETDSKGNDIPRTITVNVVKSSKILVPEEKPDSSSSEPDN